MVREIVKDVVILQTKSDPATKSDYCIIEDLLDTAIAHQETCVGLAAIQIGKSKNIIVARDGVKFRYYINPIIIKKSGIKYKAEETCLSLEGVREVWRHREITFIYDTPAGKKGKLTAIGFYAQIIQHEIDHLKGILI